MSNDPEYTQRLVELATPYWETEAELTRRFFASKPDRDVWIRYLKAAVYKELNPVIGYGPTDGYACGLHMEFSRLVDGFEAVDDGMDRRSFHHRLEQMIEEFMHFCRDFLLSEGFIHIIGPIFILDSSFLIVELLLFTNLMSEFTCLDFHR